MLKSVNSSSSKAISATLTQAVKDSIQIEKFIYHVIRKESENPSYYDEVGLDKEQKKFFEDRIKEACDGTQFIFTDPDNNTCKADCYSLLLDIKNKFLPISRELTKRFFDAHNRSMNDGVFIVTVISVLISNQRKDLLSFLKVDYSTVYQQKITESAGKKIIYLERIMDSLADNKEALQKWAIIDPSELFAWDVIASQRRSPKDRQDTNKAISDYFRDFLQVGVRETASALTKRAVSETNKWIRSLHDLPADIIRGDYKARAISYFEDTDKFDTKKFIDRVLGPYGSDDMSQEERNQREELRQKHKVLLEGHLAEVGIAGQTFESKPASIPNKSKTNKWTTNTGVTISFKGTLKNNNIEVKKDGNQSIITIRATQLDQE